MPSSPIPGPPPDATTSIRGLVNTTTQSFAGNKTFTGQVSAGSLLVNSIQIDPTGASGTQVLQWNGSKFAPATLSLSSTLASSYNAGASSSDQTLTLASGKGGAVNFLYTAVSTAQTVACSIQNTTAATAGAQQYSPMLELVGQGWNNGASPASQTIKWGLQTRPVQGNPISHELVFWNSLNGGAYTETFKLLDDNQFTVTLRGNRQYLAVANSLGSGISAANNTCYLNAGGISYAQVDSTGIGTGRGDNNGSVGTSSNRWNNLYSVNITNLSTAIGTAQTVGTSLQNTTAAAAAAQQFSPMLELQGQGWGTTAGASQTVKFSFQTRPVQGTTAIGDLVLWQSLNGASYSEFLKWAYSSNSTGGVNATYAAPTPTTNTQCNTLIYTAGVGSSASNNFIGHIFDTSNAVGTTYTANRIASFRDAGTEYVGIRSDKMVFPTSYTLSNGNATAPLSWTSTAVIVEGYLSINNSAIDLNSAGTLQVGSSNTNTVLLSSGGANSATAIAASINTSQTWNTAGSTGLKVNRGNNTSGAIRIGVNSGAGVAIQAAIVEDLVCSGTVTAGQVLNWVSGQQVSSAGAASGQTNIAGVAITGGTNTTIQVCRRGLCLVNADAGITAGNMLVTSGSTAGNVATSAGPSVGALVGRATESTGTTVSGKVIADIILG